MKTPMRYPVAQPRPVPVTFGRVSYDDPGRCRQSADWQAFFIDQLGLDAG